MIDCDFTSTSMYAPPHHETIYFGSICPDKSPFPSGRNFEDKNNQASKRYTISFRHSAASVLTSKIAQEHYSVVS